MRQRGRFTPEFKAQVVHDVLTGRMSQRVAVVVRRDIPAG